MAGCRQMYRVLHDNRLETSPNNNHKYGHFYLRKC
ncbi:hypothetical protein HMPREF0326_05758 [Desulfovibrio sp. 3_1_syn3]|nr:hypothetical protein HMPREF0326_05758 [Desulfovibrio sp. 3_1_syn3]